MFPARVSLGIRKPVWQWLCLFALSVPACPAFGQQRLLLAGKEQVVYPIPLQAPSQLPVLELPDALFTGVEIVGMGEATHGTHEFFTLKRRFFQLLATRHHYRTFALEATLGGALFLNDYVTEGTGNLDSLLQKIDFWMYRSGEMKEFIEWMRGYNAGKPRAQQLTFYGLDMQSVQRPAEYLAARVNATNLPSKDTFSRLLRQLADQLEAAGVSQGKTADAGAVDRLLAIQEQLDRWLKKAAPELGRFYPALKIQQLNLCMLNLRQAILGINSSTGYRDSCMALNVQHIRALEQGRMMLWAHNVHIGKQDPAVDYRFVQKPLGEHLDRHFGAAYYPIGFVFNKGRFTAISVEKGGSQPVYGGAQQFRVPTLLKGGLAHVLSRTGIPAFFIPLDQGSHPLFSTVQKTYLVGAVYSKKHASYAIYFTPDRMFRGLIFVDTTTGIRLTR